MNRHGEVPQSHILALQSRRNFGRSPWEWTQAAYHVAQLDGRAQAPFWGDAVAQAHPSEDYRMTFPSAAHLA